MLLRHESGASTVVDVSYAAHRTPTPFLQTLVEVEGREGTGEILEGEVLRVRADRDLRAGQPSHLRSGGGRLPFRGFGSAEHHSTSRGCRKP